MREILRKIFDNNNFMVNSFENGDYYSSKVKSENYIVYFIEDLCKEDIDNILDEKILDIGLENINKEMKKNTSVIFVVKTESSELNNEERKIVFKIEEDPYFYKKYVLWFTEKELKNIDLYMDDMTYYLMDKELFKNMKDMLEEPDEYMHEGEDINVYSYMLLCRMFIKLPFLSLKSIYNKNDNNELQNFEKNIHSILERYSNLAEELDNDAIILDIKLSEDDERRYLDKVEKDIIS